MQNYDEKKTLIMSRKFVHKKCILATVITCMLFFITIPNLTETFAIQYKGYTSNKYQITFQYPSSWDIKEKSNNYGQAPAIRIVSMSPTGELIDTDESGMRFNAVITIGPVRHDIPLNSFSDFNTYVEKLQNDLVNKNESMIIQKPTYMTIDGKQAGTFMFASKPEMKMGYSNTGTLELQVWVALTKDFAYFISFLTSSASFNNPENIQIRDQFIKSIDFF